MFDYAIETFLLDIYYPVDNISLEADGDKRSIGQALAKIGNRILAVIARILNVITRATRFLKEKITGKDYIYAPASEFKAIDEIGKLLLNLMRISTDAITNSDLYSYRAVLNGTLDGTAELSKLENTINAIMKENDDLKNEIRLAKLDEIERRLAHADADGVKVSNPASKYQGLITNLENFKKYYDEYKKTAGWMIQSAKEAEKSNVDPRIIAAVNKIANLELTKVSIVSSTLTTCINLVTAFINNSARGRTEPKSDE